MQGTPAKTDAYFFITDYQRINKINSHFAPSVLYLCREKGGMQRF